MKESVVRLRVEYFLPRNNLILDDRLTVLLDSLFKTFKSMNMEFNKIIHETMKALKKIMFGRVLGLVAVLCVSWVTILITNGSRWRVKVRNLQEAYIAVNAILLSKVGNIELKI